MASNVSQNTIPSLWSSANDDVIYTFSFKPLLMNGIGDDGNGNAQIVLFGTFDVAPLPGEYIYVFSSIYNGTYKILESFNNDTVTINTPYVGDIDIDTFNCYHLRVPTFSVYKGYKPGEDFPTELPYIKVVDVKPSVLYDDSGFPYLSINLKAITSRMFKITSNTVANSTDFSMFNAIRLSWDNTSTSLEAGNDFNCVFNTALTNEEFVKNYISVGVYAPLNPSSIYLTPINKPLLASSGVTFASAFSIVVINILVAKMYPVVFKFINGIKQ